MTERINYGGAIPIGNIRRQDVVVAFYSLCVRWKLWRRHRVTRPEPEMVFWGAKTLAQSVSLAIA